MTALSKATLKNIWKARFQPQASDFANLIDSWTDYNYQGAQTGAVTRSLAEKVGDVVSVKDFGAVGDGVTNDAVALQSAATAGGTIYVPAGTYRVNQTINLSHNTILSIDRRATITHASAGGVVFTIRGEITNSATFTAVTAGAYQITPASVSGYAAGDMIMLQGDDAAEVCTVASVSGGVFVLAAPISFSYLSAVPTVVRVSAISNVVITGGTIVGGIEIRNADAALVDQVNIVSGDISNQVGANAAWRSVRIMGCKVGSVKLYGGAITDCVISRNYVSAGFNLTAHASGAQITGNRVNGSTFGFSIRSGRGTFLSNNSISVSGTAIFLNGYGVNLVNNFMNAQVGIEFDGFYDPKPVQTLVEGNVIQADACISFISRTHQYRAIDLVGNQMTGRICVSASPAVSINMVANNLIADGIIIRCASVSACSFIGNTMLSQAGSVEAACVRLEAGGNYVFSDNTLVRGGTDATLLRLGGQNWVINGNRFRKSGDSSLPVVVTTGTSNGRGAITGNQVNSPSCVFVSVSGLNASRLSLAGNEVSQTAGLVNIGAVQRAVTSGDVDASLIITNYAILTVANTTVQSISNGYDGQIVMFRTNTSTQSIVFEDGTGNLRMNGNFTLDNDEDTITFMKAGSNWLEISRSDNGA